VSNLKLAINNNAQYLFTSVSPTDGTTVVPLTSCTKAVFSILKADGSGYALQLDSSTKPLQVVINTTAGTVTVKILPANSTGFVPGTLSYDVQLTFSDGTVLTLVKNYLDIENAVTASVQSPVVPISLDDITVDMVKAYYNRPADDTAHDTQISMLIPQVIALVRRETRRDFKTKSVVESTNSLGPLPTYGPQTACAIPTGAEVYDSPRIYFGNTSFFTRYKPIIKINAVYEDLTLLTENVDYVVYHQTGEVRKLSNYLFAVFSTYGGSNYYYTNYNYWMAYPGKIQISYTTGETPTQDLIYAALEIIGIRAGLKSRTYVTNEGVSQAVLMTEIPKEIYRIFRMHRKIRV
jgi:hypothetical protein